MSKNSTLVFFVKNFQPELKATTKEVEQFENYLTKNESAEIAPSQKTIDNILGFARSYEVLKTENTGHVEMILN